MANHYTSIVVAIDGSKEAEYAFHKSIDVATRNEGSTLNLVNVIDTRSFAAIEAYAASIADKAKQDVQEMLDGYKRKAELAGIKNINILIESGSPRHIITKELSQSVNADLIICGATGLNAVEHILIGSVSEAIVRSAKCDVLVIRTPK